jgi:hypothetical protein
VFAQAESEYDEDAGLLLRKSPRSPVWKEMHKVPDDGGREAGERGQEVQVKRRAPGERALARHSETQKERHGGQFSRKNLNAVQGSGASKLPGSRSAVPCPGHGVAASRPQLPAVARPLPHGRAAAALPEVSLFSALCVARRFGAS